MQVIKVIHIAGGGILQRCPMCGSRAHVTACRYIRSDIDGNADCTTYGYFAINPSINGALASMSRSLLKKVEEEKQKVYCFDNWLNAMCGFKAGVLNFFLVSTTFMSFLFFFELYYVCICYI